MPPPPLSPFTASSPNLSYKALFWGSDKISYADWISLNCEWAIIRIRTYCASQKKLTFSSLPGFLSGWYLFANLWYSYRRGERTRCESRRLKRLEKECEIETYPLYFPIWGTSGHPKKIVELCIRHLTAFPKSYTTSQQLIASASGPTPLMLCSVLLDSSGSF